MVKWPLFGELPENTADEAELRAIHERFIADSGKLGVGGIDLVLIQESERAAARSRTAFRSGSRDREAGAAAAAILCGAAACEARLSEYLAHAEFAAGELSADLDAIRRNRSGLHQCRDLLKLVRPGLDLGRLREYQPLGCLFKLRDTIAHRNARLIELNMFPDLLRPCVEQGMIPVRRQEYFEWTSVVLVHEVGVWAAATARNWLDFAREHVPFVC